MWWEKIKRGFRQNIYCFLSEKILSKVCTLKKLKFTLIKVNINISIINVKIMCIQKSVLDVSCFEVDETYH